MDDTRERIWAVTAEARAPVRSGNAWSAWRWPAVFFALTIVSMLFAGAAKAGSPFTLLDLPRLLAHPEWLLQHLVRGIPFAASMLSILFAHEMGHYITAGRHGVDATPPYFIPFPTLLGTLGAVIKLKSTLPTRTALIDVGASGPIAGFLVAVPLLLWGLAHSSFEPLPPWPVPNQTIPQILGAAFAGEPVAGPVAGVLIPGESLLLASSRWLVLGAVPEGFYLSLHPVAWAAAFGLFVTALNLLPVGQLDGGHVLFALVGQHARTAGRVLVGALLIFGLLSWPGWLLWALLAGKVIGTRHPPVEDADVPLARNRRVVGWIALAMLVLTFAPMPVMVR